MAHQKLKQGNPSLKQGCSLYKVVDRLSQGEYIVIEYSVRWRAMFSLVGNLSCAFVSGEEFVSRFLQFSASLVNQSISFLQYRQIELETGT